MYFLTQFYGSNSCQLIQIFLRGRDYEKEKSATGTQKTKTVEKGRFSGISGGQFSTGGIIYNVSAKSGEL